MAISVFDIGTAQINTGTSVSLTGVNVPSASLIFAAAMENSSSYASGSISDGVNTWHPVTSTLANLTKGGGVSVFYAENAHLTNGTITYTLGDTLGTEAAIVAIYATGVLTSSSLDANITNSVEQGPSTSVSMPASGPPAVVNELIIGIACASLASGNTLTNTGGYSTPPDTVIQGGCGLLGGGYIIDDSLSMPTYTATLSTSVIYGAIIVGFQPAPVSPVIARNIQQPYFAPSWDYVFSVGWQPFGKGLLNPTVLSIPPPQNPPFTHPERTASQGVIFLAASQPAIWPYVFTNGSQPYGNSLLYPSALTRTLPQNPPFTHPERTALHSAVDVLASQPTTWPYVFTPDQQTYGRSLLNPVVLNFAPIVNNPPFRHWERTAAGIAEIVQGWQPDLWPYQFTGDRQPYAANLLSPTITTRLPPQNPPFLNRGRTAEEVALIIRAWQPDPWVYLFTGGRQPYDVARVNPLFLNIIPKVSQLLRNVIKRTRILPIGGPGPH